MESSSDSAKHLPGRTQQKRERGRRKKHSHRQKIPYNRQKDISSGVYPGKQCSRFSGRRGFFNSGAGGTLTVEAFYGANGSRGSSIITFTFLPRRLFFFDLQPPSPIRLSASR